MTLVERIEALSGAIANYIRDFVLPRLIPGGGAQGYVLTKSSAANYAVGWSQVSGAGAVVESAVITVSTAAYDSYTATVVNASVSETSMISAWLVPGDDFDADDLAGLSLYALPKNGEIDFTITENGPIVGDYIINYTVS